MSYGRVLAAATIVFGILLAGPAAVEAVGGPAVDGIAGQAVAVYGCVDNPITSDEVNRTSCASFDTEEECAEVWEDDDYDGDSNDSGAHTLGKLCI